MWWPAGGSTLPTDYTFTGQRDEGGVGLMDYHARFYAPYIARFISADSIVPDSGDPQLLNRYSYCLGNPVKYTDPSGYRIAQDPDANLTWAPYGDSYVIVGAPEALLNEWERRYANYVLTGDEGFFPGEGHPVMYRNIDYTLAILGGMGAGAGCARGERHLGAGMGADGPESRSPHGDWDVL